MSLHGPERLARLRLARSEGIGPVTFRELLRRFGSASDALAAAPDLARRAGRTAPLRLATAADASREVEAGERLGAELLVLGDDRFPGALAALDPPPPVLWALGDADLLSKPSVAVVGARAASAGGQRFARALAAELGRRSFVVVSGLARGIDGAAHQGALESGTVAVLAGGVDDIYPPEHAELHRRIADRGCVVSENPPGRRAKAQDFPRRNRIISGLSQAVVVVEAELRSGSLITARLAAEQGREVLAVPGSPLDPRARGCNDLIRNGAAVCEGAEDVINALGDIRSLREPQGDLFSGAPEDRDAIDRAADALRERTFDLLSHTPTPRDELVRAVDAPAAHVMAALVELALAGRAELLPGGLVARL
ncbi:DNA-processing protein DprA [soil metagenome]